MTTSPPAPEPDAKDWTWAIREQCPECGYDPRRVQRSDVAALTRRYAAVLVDRLGRDGAASRPQPTTWSALEYGCHVRDVCTRFGERLALMLATDDPEFENWDQDVTAREDRYWEQQPAAVAAQLRTAADTIAGAFGAVRDDQWPRPGRRSNGSAFTVDTFARYFLHDLAHHAWDVSGSGR